MGGILAQYSDWRKYANELDYSGGRLGCPKYRYYGYGSPRLRAKVAAAEPGQFVLVRVRMRRIDGAVTCILNLAKAYFATVLDVQVSESRP